MMAYTQGLEAIGFDRLKEHIAHLADTPMGKGVILSLMPKADPLLVEQEMLKTQEMRLLLKLSPGLDLAGIEDITVILQRLGVQGMCLDLSDLVRIRELIQGFRKFREALQEREDLFPKLWGWLRSKNGLRDVLGEIQKVITPEGELRDDASQDLLRIRRQKGYQRQLIMRKYEAFIRDLGLRVAQEVGLRGGRYVIPVRSEELSRVKGIVHDLSRSKSTFFVEPFSMVAENNRLQELEQEELEEIERILAGLTDTIRPHATTLKDMLDTVAELDSLLAKARFGERFSLIPPTFGGDKILLKEALNPLLLIILGQEAKRPVPIHLELGGEARMLVISGPNRGGKTVALKTLGLICLMAQCGIPIPAQEGSSLPIFSHILAEIGDEQDVFQGESTFSAHIKGLCGILSKAGEGVLALVDEPGMGTSPEEGSAIAVAILEELLDSGCYSLITTHFDSLKAWAFTQPKVRLASVGFDPILQRPNYQLSYGLVGSSHALEMAQDLGMDQRIIERAKELLGPQRLRLEEILSHLEESQRELEALKLELKDLIQENRAKQEELKREKEELETQFQNLLSEKRKELQGLLADARRQAAEIIQRFKEEKSKAQAITQRALKELEQNLTHVAGPQAPVSVTKGNGIKPGDFVVHRAFNQKGRVLAVLEQGKRVLVQFGGVKVELDTAQLELGDSTKLSSGDHGSGVSWKFKDPLVLELNVIGQRVPEALHLVEKALNRALVEGRDEIRIVHGYGSGLLRRAIREHLMTFPYVKSMRPEEPQLGGDAVTVVEL